MVMQLKCETACLLGVLTIILLKIIAQMIIICWREENKKKTLWADRKWKSIQCKHLLTKNTENTLIQMHKYILKHPNGMIIIKITRYCSNSNLRCNWVSHLHPLMFFSLYQVNIKPKFPSQNIRSQWPQIALQLPVTHRNIWTVAPSGARHTVCFFYKSLYQKLRTDHLVY